MGGGSKATVPKGRGEVVRRTVARKNEGRSVAEGHAAPKSSHDYEDEQTRSNMSQTMKRRRCDVAPKG